MPERRDWFKIILGEGILLPISIFTATFFVTRSLDRSKSIDVFQIEREKTKISLAIAMFEAQEEFRVAILKRYELEKHQHMLETLDYKKFQQDKIENDKIIDIRFNDLTKKVKVLQNLFGGSIEQAHTQYFTALMQYEAIRAAYPTIPEKQEEADYINRWYANVTDRENKLNNEIRKSYFDR